MASTIRFGLIGAGRWGTVYIRTLDALSRRCRLTHLCTSKPESAGLVPRSVQVVRDWRALVASDCDAVIIATPPDTHAKMLEACLDAGKPCIVEKPLCLDAATAERMHQHVRKSRVPVLVDHTHLFSSTYARLKEMLHRTGEPIRLIMSEGMALGPFRSHTPALWDWAPHDVSLCLDLMGRAPGHVDALGGPADPEGDPEMVSIRLEFSGGSCAWIQAGRCAPRKRRNLTVFTDAHLYVWDAYAPEPLTVATIDFRARYAGGIAEPMKTSALKPVSADTPVARMLTYFVKGLGGGDRTYFGTALGRDVTRVLAACGAAMKRRVSAS